MAEQNIPEARARISECIKHQLTELNLGELDLTNLNELPELKKCLHVERLHLYINNISDLKPLAKLTGLTNLDLNNNNISNIEPLALLTQLKGLRLFNNSIGDITPIANLTNLTTVDLERNAINTVPPQIANIGLGFDLNSQSTSNAIRLADNPIVTPPIEIIKQGRSGFIYWYETRE